ncbi:glucosamine-6-phosphate deaminase [Oceanobacillus sp. 1P07AA]|uniref:glucosamine-6-phosphate deaminase n=1 Tax=Oceanobacillus sp. 1P07AA TaxID=3132293 RepID=UPI0039A6C973
MKIIQTKNYQSMSKLASQYVINTLKQIDKPVLGLATGSTPEGLYQHLIKAYQTHQISFANVSTFNLDEYVGLDKEDKNSYHYYMHKFLFNHVDVPSRNIHLPNGIANDLNVECTSYENRIQSVGGIHIQILGIGKNGHIGFNEPGTSFESRTHVVDLDESTRRANARFFDSFDEVPNQAITMGIQSIMQAKEILLLVSGSEKAEALEKLVNGKVNEDFPASILQTHQNVKIIADKAALENISYRYVSETM